LLLMDSPSGAGVVEEIKDRWLQLLIIIDGTLLGLILGRQAAASDADSALPCPPPPTAPPPLKIDCECLLRCPPRCGSAAWRISPCWQRDGSGECSADDGLGTAAARRMMLSRRIALKHCRPLELVIARRRLCLRAYGETLFSKSAEAYLHCDSSFACPHAVSPLFAE